METVSIGFGINLRGVWTSMTQEHRGVRPTAGLNPLTGVDRRSPSPSPRPPGRAARVLC
jgi:hypothetical protein